MPEPSPDDSGGGGGRIRRPQPRPRLSLVSRKNDNDPCCPLYENLENGYSKAVQKTEEEEGSAGSDNSCERTGLEMATSNSSSKSGPYRRSTLPVATTSSLNSCIPVSRRTANTLDSKVVSAIPRMSAQPAIGIVGAPQGSFLHNTFKLPTPSSIHSSAMISNLSNAQSSTIKCMPYNSPRLAAKGSKFTANDHGASCGSISSVGRTGSSGMSSKPAYCLSTRTVNVDVSSSQESLSSCSITKKDTRFNSVTVSSQSVSTIKTFSKAPRTLKNKTMSENRVLTTHHGSLDRLSDSSSSMCSTDSLLSNSKDIIANGSKSEYRKSASIPPQMVATLANQFNALIEQNRNALIQGKSATNSAIKKASPALVKTSNLNAEKKGLEVPSSLNTSVHSCPSSPLHGGCGSGQILRSKKQQRVGVPAGGVGMYRRGCLFSDKGYVSANDGNESSDTESAVREITSNKVKQSRTFVTTKAALKEFKDLDDNDGAKEFSSGKMSIVQRAIQNYEGTMKKSSPELQRRNRSLPSISSPPVGRSSHTLPATTVVKETNLTMKARIVTVQTLPLSSSSSSWTSTKSRESATSHLNSLLQQPKVSVERTSSNEKLVEVKAKHNSIPPVAVQRTSLLNKQRNSVSGSLASISSEKTVVTCQTSVTSEVSCMKSNDIFHARPAVVSGQVDSKHDDRPVDPEKSHYCANSRGKSMFEKRAAFLSDVIRETAHQDDGLSDHSTESMDLLAEIDSHPRIRAAVADASKCRAKFGNHRDNEDDDDHSEQMDQVSVVNSAPNVSFLWKHLTRTQTYVARKLPNLPSFAGNPVSVSDSNGLLSMVNGTNSEPLEDGGSAYYDDEEHLYEELANCISKPTNSSRNSDIPIALPELDDDEEDDDEHCVLQPSKLTTNVHDNARNSLESRTTEKSSSLDHYTDADFSDGSWTDESDEDDEDEQISKSSSLLNKSRSKTKRSHQRKGMTRRSWSQSLRDLANSGEDNDEGPWEEEIGSDDSSSHIYTEPVLIRRAESNDAATDSVTPDTDSSDKSPTSIPNGSSSDGTKNDHSGNNVREQQRKTKQVRRNWSWSKTDFRLDFSSKLSKIRINKKTSASEMTIVNADLPCVELSPTKKKQWPFKSRNHSKKVERVSPKRTPSPKKESAQFYVPTMNSDGSLASPPGHLSNLDFKVSVSQVNNSVSHFSTEHPSDTRTELERGKPTSGSAAATVKTARRISSGSTNVTRPKTAPPAPPIMPSKRTPSAHSLNQEQKSENNERSANSAYVPVKTISYDAISIGSGKCLQVDAVKSDSISERKRSPSSVSSDSELIMTIMNHPKIRVSAASEHSGSSYDSYTQIEEVETVPGPHGEMLTRFLQTDHSTSHDSSSKSNSTDDSGIGSKGFLYLDDTYYIDDDRNLKLSPFEDEPLYQFYNMNAQQRAAHENQIDNSDDDCYEKLYQSAPSESSTASAASNIPSAMDLVRSTVGGMRTLWCEVPEVISSRILESMTSQQRKVQEAMFEVITSEASYLKSLNVLVNNFIMCPYFADDYSMDCILSKREREVLFSDVIPVRETSERLLTELEKRWQENIVISDICDILQEHATKHFDVYVKYCSNQVHQDRCLKKLKETNTQFLEVLKNIETHPVCQNLTMYSFLMLPMQRITRLPLLVDAIFKHLDHGTKAFETCRQALATLNKIVHECNEGALRMERMEEMLTISRQLDFRDLKGVALISASRWLVKQGEVARLQFYDASKLHFGRRCTKQTVHLFLFTDLLIISKRKNDDCYIVLDYCPRNMVQVTEIDRLDQIPERPPDGCKNLFLLTMLQNHENKTVEMYFCCQMESDLTRWIEAVTPKKSENPDERIYEEWDCPQVQAIHSYVAQQSDELSIEESDVVNVFRKLADGWYQGERIRDGVSGWFPSNYTVEIVSSHVRARNLRQRYRLLALSHSYLEEQRKKENKSK